MKKALITWIAKTICMSIWKNYEETLKLKNTQIKNLKQKNQLLQMEINAYNHKYNKYFN